MGKFGKKNVVSANLNDYMIGIIGPSGFGKSTLMFNVCNKLFGEDGYIILDMGQEDGVKAIDGCVSERVPNYGTLNEIVTDIVKNKTTDYPNLKVVVFDTLDAYYEIVEDYVVKDWNASNANTPNFVKAKSINGVDGGYGRGLEKVNEIAKKVAIRLDSVGVKVWWTAHIREKDITDIYTGTTYTQLTANMMAKYFNAFKNVSHIVACGYYDRAIEKREVGDENPVTKKKKQRNALTDETRKIKFRDDMLIADAKSRFKEIIDEIPLDADAFIKAIQDAIKAQKTGGENVVKPVAKKEPIVSNVAVETPKNANVDLEADDFDDDDLPFDVEEDVESFNSADAITRIRTTYKELPKETRLQIKAIKGDSELEALAVDDLKKIIEIINEATTIID